jgi:hypothetical protein
VRQYNRKRNAEIKLRRERRKMLEKARMKGKKGLSGTNKDGEKEGEFEDDGLCCTCGQQVGQHNHGTHAGQQGGQQGNPGGGQGPGKGK